MTDWLNRSDWLKLHGFAKDPFGSSAVNAEKDFLNDEAFVDPPDLEALIGNISHPGPCFIFGLPGSGKTSLRKRIKRHFDAELARGNTKILAVEYIEHEYPMDESDAFSHIFRIGQLIKLVLREQNNDVTIEISQTNSSQQILKGLLRRSRALGLNGLCILIDNVDANYKENSLEVFSRIELLASQLSKLNIEKIIYKFFLPLNLYELAYQNRFLRQFPFYVIRWDKHKLQAVLNQRLTMCMESRALPSITKENPSVAAYTLAELCVPQLKSSIVNTFIEFGLKFGQPRAMWQLGYHLLNEHFVSSPRTHYRRISDLIRPATLSRTYKKVENLISFPSMLVNLPPESGEAMQSEDELAPVSQGQSDKIISEVTAVVKILFLSASPGDLGRLQTDRESRTVDDALRGSEFRDKFEIIFQHAVRVDDLQGHLLRHRPDIVHFSGYSSDIGGIILEDYNGNSHPVPPDALSNLFKVFKDKIQCVVLNACFSEPQAKAISEHIGCVVGMSKNISAESSIGFVRSFYRALGYGLNVQSAFELGCIEIDLENLSEQDVPRLLVKDEKSKEIIFIKTALKDS